MTAIYGRNRSSLCPLFVKLARLRVFYSVIRSSTYARASREHRPFRKMATGGAHGATFRSRGADSESSHLICILRSADGSHFKLLSPGSEGWLKRSERNQLLGMAFNNLKLKPTTHRNEFTSRVKARLVHIRLVKVSF